MNDAFEKHLEKYALSPTVIGLYKKIITDTYEDAMRAVFEAKNKGKSAKKADLPVKVAHTGQFSNYFMEDLRKISNISMFI
ncbi:hypothetical protein ACVW0P_002072 [Mucilaginibacter sp. UYNi724]